MRKLALAFALSLFAAAPALAQPCPAIPALPDTERRTEYTGVSASTGPFNISFQLYGDSTDYANWLEVWVNGVKKTAVTDYTVATSSGPALGSACLPITNAQVTFLAAQSGTVEIVGARRPRRTSQLAENAGVTAHAFNQLNSDVIAISRERWDLNARQLRAPPGETLTTLPPAASRASTIAAWDAAGNPTTTAPSIGLGNVIGPGSSVDGHVALFNGATGTVIKDGGALTTTPANPTGAVGLTVVPGVASTILRSDAAPPLAAIVQNTIAAVNLACDGTTDDSAAFQTAINALVAPSTIALPRGTCVLHGITIPTGVSIKGSSTDGTVVAPSGNGQTVFSRAYGALTQAGFGVSDLTIDCKAFTGAIGVSVTFAKETQYRNLDIAGCATALVFDRGYEYKVSGVTVRGNASQGAGQIKAWSSDDADHIFNVSLSNVTTLNVGNGVQADALYFRRAVNSYITNYGANDLAAGGTPRNGLVIENDSQGVFVDNFIVAAAATGIVLQTGAGVAVAPSFNQFTNFGVDQSSTHGITITTGTYNVFHGGNVAASGVATNIVAISIAGGSFNTIAHTTVTGYSGAGGTAISTNAVADYTIIGNKFDNNQTCVNLPGGGGMTDFRLIDNTCTNFVAAVNGNTAGAGNYYFGNLGYYPATNGQLFIGQTAADPAWKTITGDWTVTAGGVVALNPALNFATSGTITDTNATEATTSSAASVILSGGLGIAKKIRAGGGIYPGTSTFTGGAAQVYTDAGHGLVLSAGAGASYDIGFFNRGGNELFANIAGTNDIRIVGDPALAANQGHLRTGQFPPAPTACGTTPLVSGSDTVGEVTTGTGAPTGCVLTFAVPYIGKPYCFFQQEGTPLASFSATWTNLAITIVQTATSSNQFTYQCWARSGG